MAEAATAVDPNVRYFCHMCNVEINIPTNTTANFTCPLCSEGFVEVLPANQTSVNRAAGNNTGNISGRFPNADAIREHITTILMSRNGPNIEISFDAGNQRGNLLTLSGGGGVSGSGGGGGGGNSSTGNSNGSSGSNGPSGASGTGGGRVRPQHFDGFDNVLYDFIQSLSNGDDIPFRNSHMFFMGNPGDYAWGREGIDTIVTQLLNQMETSGPPPLSKDKIAEIPSVEIVTDDVNKKLQCSVCWEDFILKETVRKLPCSHIYHENCIVPWLKLHGTCPICRKSLIDENNDGSNAMDIGMESSGSGGGAPSNNANNSNRNSSVASNFGETSQNQNQRNGVFDFEGPSFTDLD